MRTKSESSPCFPRARGDGPVQDMELSGGSQLPPRSRGWTRRWPCSVFRSRASPALAGMDPSRLSGTPPGSGFPRARGDGPARLHSGSSSFALPPRSRGWTFPGVNGLLNLSASPALAGMDLNRRGLRCRCSGFPRARGDGPLSNVNPVSTTSLPPRSRGWTRCGTPYSTRMQASPALAGMDPAGRRRRWRGQSFPRARGDGPSVEALISSAPELPPRSRGWTRNRYVSAPEIIASPALAGMDPSGPGGRRFRCGFPRARGDGPLQRPVRSVQRQLPPRSRGWTHGRRRRAVPRQASPALAGMDPDRSRPDPGRHRFPRARGDGPDTIEVAYLDGKLPPRSRGWTRQTD